MSVQIIDTEKFKAEIFDFTKEKSFSFNKEKPIVLNFSASWCGPCKVFGPALEEVAKEHDGEFNIYKIDIDKDPQVPALFGIRSVPSTVFFIPNDQPVLITGNIGKEGLDRAVKEFLGPK